MRKNEKEKKKCDATQSAELEKMSIYDYEQKYVKRQNVRGAKILLRLIAAAIGIFLFACLFFISLRVWELNEYAGYAVGAVCVVV